MQLATGVQFVESINARHITAVSYARSNVNRRFKVRFKILESGSRRDFYSDRMRLELITANSFTAERHSARQDCRQRV